MKTFIVSYEILMEGSAEIKATTKEEAKEKYQEMTYSEIADIPDNFIHEEVSVRRSKKI